MAIKKEVSMAGVTKAAAKVAGKAKGAAKALGGYPKIFHHLAAEHAEVATLLKRVAATSEGSSVRAEIFPDIYTNLTAHAEAEEKEFYPVLERFTELKTLIARCHEDHALIKECLEKLHGSNMATKTWTMLFERFKNAVTSHVEREEEELFPKASEHWSREGCE